LGKIIKENRNKDNKNNENGGLVMESQNKLDQVPVAAVKPDELVAIQNLESQLENKYYLIAFKK